MGLRSPQWWRPRARSSRAKSPFTRTTLALAPDLKIVMLVIVFTKPFPCARICARRHHSQPLSPVQL